MMNNRNFRSLPVLMALLAGATVLAGCATTSESRQPAAEWDGLVLRPGTRLDAVWELPDAQIPAYRSVMIDPVSVSFARDWDPNAGRRMSQRVGADDIAAIRESLAELFHEIFRAELTSGGFQLVDEPGPETLRVMPAIINLRVTAPDTMGPGRTRTYTASAGSMTLLMELRDSASGELLARVVDQQTARRGGSQMMITNRVTNTADARRAINVWASALRRGLDELYGRSAGE